jgi:F-type H+-transporting ATPase subunit delta
LIGSGEIARRYARAVFGLGRDAAARAQLLVELDALALEISESPELVGVLFKPIHPRSERKAVMREVAQRLGASTEVRAVAEILLDQNRAPLLLAIRDELRKLVDAEAGRIEARVATARALTPEAQEQLRQAISRRVNADVTLVVELDPTLIGGIVARIGDLLLDGSIRTQLENLGANLRKGPAT